MPPIVSIVGRSSSGKTTLVEALVRELKRRGFRVSTIKHTPQGMNIDEPDTDSWRHIQAGSEATAISSTERLVLFKPIPLGATLDEIARILGEDCDIILAEGFKQSDMPKIEVHRKESGPPLSSVRKLFAIATDEPLDTKVRQFSLNDTKGLVDLLEEGFIKPQLERTAIYVNGVPVPLTSFPRSIIEKILIAMVSSLKGVDEVRSLDIFLRRVPAKKFRSRV
ncbi:MAG: molybdopterin-guanine dinucleotide biosynthesis protein B [Dehalococcoidales bacterium]|nr:molybdopterin-guanine dinucleotide biosynthesis protein B [Dehalococcoidales bacterium]